MDPQVAIIGGGLAGMAAAAKLIDRPLRVTLLEARRITGGRAGSFTDTTTGQEVDYCQHVAMGCCAHFRDLLCQAGLEQYLERTNQLAFLAPENQSTSYFSASKWLPPPLHFVPTFLSLRFLTWREKWQIARAMAALLRYQSPTPGDEAAHGQTMQQWLENHGQSAATIRKFWNLVLASALGEDVSHVAVAPARKVFLDGFLANRHAADLLIPNRPLSWLFGTALPAYLRSQRIQLKMGCRVRSCHPGQDQQIELSWQDRNRTTHRQSFDAVILAVPWFALPNLLADSPLSSAIAQLDAIAQFPTAPISGIHLWLDRPLTQRRHTVIVDRLVQWVFALPSAGQNPPDIATPPACSSTEPLHYYQVVISAAHQLRHLEREALLQKVVTELRESFPAAQDWRVQHSRFVTDPAAVFSVTPAVERLRPCTETSHPRLILAGDYVRTGWPATMEGAVISGFQAAESVLRQFAGAAS